jgi:signal transduction histidine kinase/ActR/RegA family two-component response regulator
MDPDATGKFEIHLDAATARAQKAQRARRFNVVTVPALRLLGFTLVAGILLVHNALLLGGVDWRQYITFVVVTLAYVLASWAALAAFYRPFARFDIAFAFLIADIGFWALAVYVSGGERSWMYFLVLAHVLDQGTTKVRYVRIFAHVGVLAYVGVLAWVHFVDGRALAWGAAIAKTASLYAFGLYGSLAAVPAEALRQRLASAVRVARATLADLAEQRQQLEEKSAQLEEAKRRAEEASRAKTEFLSRVSHEMRTPMNAILGFAQVLEADALAPDQHANVSEILGAGEHLLALIDDILEIEDIEQRRVAVDITAVRAADVVVEVLRLGAPLAARNSVALHSYSDEDLAVYADRRRLKQIVLNLVANGVKYNRAGGSVTVGCARTGAERVRISVEDTGIGISPERIGELFRPFHRFGDDASSIPGMGLGLAVCRTLAVAMDGELGVESIPGSGSTFWLDLPAAPAVAAPLAADDTAAGSAASATAAPHPALRPPHVLCVEDNPSNARLVELLLGRRLGMRLSFAATAAGALELARREPPDLILLDLNLPDGSGLDVLQTLRADPRTRATKVLVVSADAVHEHVASLLDAGADDYVTKPYDINHFIDVVRAWLPDTS